MAAGPAGTLSVVDETEAPPRDTILVHDGATGEQLALIEQGRDPIIDWQFAPDGRTLAVTRDNTVGLVSLNQRR